MGWQQFKRGGCTLPGKMNLPGGGDTVRHMRAAEKRAGPSHSQQILAPTFQLLGNLQICSGHLGNGRLGKGGSLQEVAAGLERRQVRAAESWAFAKSPAGQLVHNLH